MNPPITSAFILEGIRDHWRVEQLILKEDEMIMDVETSTLPDDRIRLKFLAISGGCGPELIMSRSLAEKITTKPGLILDATLIQKVVTANPKTKPTIIVFVDPSDRKAFEKQIEGDSQVLGYKCDPRTPSIIPTEWTRK